MIRTALSRIGAVAVLLLGSTVVAPAQTTSSSQAPPEETYTVPKSMLSQDQLRQLEARQTREQIEAYGEYAGLGKEIGVAINEGLKAVTEQTAVFAQTGVGKLTMFLIVWHVAGIDFVQILVGIPLFAVGFVVIVWSYRRNCVTRKVLVERGADKARRYEIINKGVNAYEQWGHLAAFVLLVIICSLTIFV